MKLDRRLARAQDELSKKGIGRLPPVMRGALEVHCIGGLSHMEGEICLEHEDCVYHSTPVLGRIRRQILVVWKLEMDVDNTRKALVQRARMLAERLTRVANGLEADPDFSINTVGELQGNGVELDTWCAKLGFARETLKLVRQAVIEDESAAACG